MVYVFYLENRQSIDVLLYLGAFMNWKKSLELCSVPYEEEMAESLRNDPAQCIGLLNATIGDPDPLDFLLALNDVINAHGGIKEIASKSGLTQKKLKSIFSAKEELDLSSLAKIMKALGLNIAFQTPEEQIKKHRKVAISRTNAKIDPQHIRLQNPVGARDHVPTARALGCKKKPV